jgi:cell division inhibitor SulA
MTRQVKEGAESVVEDENRRADIDQLVRRSSLLWRGGSRSSVTVPSLDSGYEALNNLLPTGGWPVQSVIEIVVDEWGSGELQVLLPLMRQLSQQKSYLALVSPPYLPYAPALHNAGIVLNQLVIIDQQVNAQDRWWSAEKILRHGDCGLVMMWPERPDEHNPKAYNRKAYKWGNHIRRLQVAAEAGNSTAFIFRRGRPVETPVSMRLKLAYCAEGIRVQVLKSRFSWKQGSVVIPVPESEA